MAKLFGYEILKSENLFNVSEARLWMPVLSANYGDGYGDGALVGHSAGLRRWTMEIDLLPDLEEYAVDGETRFEYLWEFYRARLGEGNRPFILADRRTGKNFLVSFEETTLTFSAFNAKLYSGSLVIRQRRARRMTFNEADGSLLLPTDFEGLLFACDIDNTDVSEFSNGQAFPFWTDFSGNDRTLEAEEEDAGNQPVYTIDGAGGLSGVYWYGTSCPLQFTEEIHGVKHIFVVATFADETFSGYEGLLTDLGTTALLVGGAAGTKIFYDNEYETVESDDAEPYVYKLNRQQFAESAQRAPVGGKLGVVSIRSSVGWNLDGLQIGQDRDDAARKWKGAVRKVYGFDRILTADEEEQFIKFLASSSDLLHAKWIGAGDGLSGEYFNNTDLSGSPVLERTDAEINFNWGSGSPDALVNADEFSARWEGFIQFPFDGDYRISAHVDDGVRVYLNGILAIEDWQAQPPRTLTSDVVSAKAGQYIPIEIEYFENQVYAEIQLLWSHVRMALETVPAEFLYSSLPTGPTVLSFSGSIVTYAGEIVTFEN